ncbi:twin-arginine translocase TatA/TatE family subunit [Solilutibacter silvestris]|uniref:twin-arginine translocase TatA/TatE family subunit n=1 Tax=Solilutibacter silvestris TaxID=1645665 RepID=UPI003D328505
MFELSFGKLLILLVIILLVFGTKRLTSGARDIGKAVNEFKKGMHGNEEEKKPESLGDESQRNGDTTQSQQRQDDQAPR